MTSIGYSKEYDMFIHSYKGYLKLIEKRNCEYDIDDKYKNIIYKVCKEQTEIQKKENKFIIDPIKYFDYLSELCIKYKLYNLERAYALYYLSDWENFIYNYYDEDIPLNIFISNNLDNEFENIPK